MGFIVLYYKQPHVLRDVGSLDQLPLYNECGDGGNWCEAEAGFVLKEGQSK